MEFVLNRNHLVRSLTGHCIAFKKGEPVYVPPIMHKEVVAIGAEPVDGSKIEMLDPEKKEVTPLTPGEREELLFVAFAELEARNLRGDFNAQGLPNIKPLETLTGIADVTANERSEAWQKYREAKAS